MAWQQFLDWVSIKSSLRHDWTPSGKLPWLSLGLVTARTETFFPFRVHWSTLILNWFWFCSTLTDAKTSVFPFLSRPQAHATAWGKIKFKFIGIDENTKLMKMWKWFMWYKVKRHCKPEYWHNLGSVCASTRLSSPAVYPNQTICPETIYKCVLWYLPPF